MCSTCNYKGFEDANGYLSSYLVTEVYLLDVTLTERIISWQLKMSKRANLLYIDVLHVDVNYIDKSDNSSKKGEVDYG